MSSEYERLKKLAGIEDEQKAASSGFARLKALAGGESAPVAKVIASEMEKRNAELLAERARTYTPAGYSDMPLPGLGIGNGGIAGQGVINQGAINRAPTGVLPMFPSGNDAYQTSARAALDDYNAQRQNISGQIEANNAFAWDAEITERITALPEALRARVLEFPEKTQIGIGKGKDHSGNNPAYFKALYGDLEKQGINSKLAGEMLTYSERLYNERKMTEREERAQKFADEKPVRASAASVPANLAAGAGILDAAAQKAARALTKSRAPVDYNTAAFAPAKFSRAVRGAVSENIGNPAGQFLYGAGMSMADSTVVAGLTAIGFPGAVNLLGGSAATSAALDAKARGASDTQALLFGAASGVAETLFEKISLESLLDKNVLAGIGALPRREALGELAKNALRQAGVEATEEGATTIANAITDRLIMGGASEYEQTVLKYRAAGYSAENAKLSAQAEFVKSLASDMAAGALSGGVMGGFTDVGTYAKDAKRARAGYTAVGGDGAATRAKGAGNSARAAAQANPSSVTDLEGGAGAAKYSAMYRNPAGSVDSFYDFAVNNRNNSTERNKSFFTYETPEGGNVDLPFDAALHLKDSHNLTGAQVATLLGSIDNIQTWAKAPDVNSNYDGTPLKIITDINGKHAGILLEALPNGRVFVRTAFFGNDNRLADWIRKSDPRALTSDSKAGEYFTGDRLSLDNMLSQLNGDVNTQNAGNGGTSRTPSPTDGGNVTGREQVLRKLTDAFIADPGLDPTRGRAVSIEQLALIDEARRRAAATDNREQITDNRYGRGAANGETTPARSATPPREGNLDGAYPVPRHVQSNTTGEDRLTRAARFRERIDEYSARMNNNTEGLQNGGQDGTQSGGAVSGRGQGRVSDVADGIGGEGAQQQQGQDGFTEARRAADIRRGLLQNPGAVSEGVGGGLARPVIGDDARKTDDRTAGRANPSPTGDGAAYPVKTSAKALGIPGASDVENLTVIPESVWDEGLRAAADEAAGVTGGSVTFVLGNIRTAAGNTRGVFLPDGNMIIQADDAGATAEQLVRHETYHALEKFSVGAGFKPAQNGEGGSNGTRAALKPAPTMLHHQKGDKFMTG